MTRRRQVADGVRGWLASPGGQVWLLVAALAAAALAAAVLLLPGLPRESAAPALPLVLLVAVFAGTELVRVHLHFRGEAHTITTAEVALVLALLFAAPVEVLAAQLLGCLFVRLRSGQSAVKVAFNLAIAAFDACLAILVFRTLVEVPAPADPATWLAAALATLTTTVSSTLLVAAVIAISEREFDRQVVVTALGPAVLITGVNTALGLALAMVVHVEPLGVVLLLLPALLTVVGYRAYTSQVEERHRVEVLLACSRLLSTSAPLPERLGAALELSRDTLRASAVELALLPDRGLPVPTWPTADGPLLRLAEVAADGLPRRHDGIRGDEAVRHHLRALGAEQGIVVPLRSGDTRVGAIVAVDRLGQVSRYNEQDERLLRAVAEQIAGCLQREALTHSVEQLHAAHAQLTHQAHHDPLTGLANRRQLLHRLGQSLYERTTGGASPALVLLDLDGFKLVNDTLGHSTGDALLRLVADRLAAACRPEDLPARLGGDEFVVLLAGPLDEAAAAALTARVRQAVCGPAVVDGHTVHVRASFGVALTDGGAHDAAQALQRADHAMYDAKRHRDGSVRTYDARDEARDEESRRMSAALEVGLAARQVHLVYQPVVNVATGALAGVEALARWHSPALGVVPPDVFIPLAESTGQIVALGRHVLVEACRQLAVWQAVNPRSRHTMSVNVSVQQLLEPDLLEEVKAVLASTGADPSRLVLEVTESQVLTDQPSAGAFLHAVRSLGVRVAIDDFGSGYASVNHLRRLPVDILKIDRTLVQGALHSQADAEICRSIIALAGALHLTVVAEGVENAGHARLVEDLGCMLAQGYHHGRPSTADEIDGLMLDHELATWGPVRPTA